MQDMPPPGGFGFIPTERTLPKPILRQSLWLGITVALTLYGVNWLHHWRKRYRILRIEQNEHFIATAPFLYAEQDRKYLIQLYKNREFERELMKDHPNWKVGTLYGEEVYKTLPKEYLPNVSAAEFQFGRSLSEWTQRVVLMDFWK